ncbi:formylglycine-generating enzyme family protein [Salinicola tamaricis]|uniref:formylglycine-generating enzyme family protein n=1 Tax=Salinicola tamaricis TaxID=1771309 RepID=UPI003BF61296
MACQGNLTAVFLPTEAQWEYAARSGGKLIPYGTSTGTLEKGTSIPTQADVDKSTSAGDNSIYAPYPVRLYPPNGLGIYQMGGNGYAWVIDWYQSDYYQHSPRKNPQGPSSGNEKVVRGLAPGEGLGGRLTMERYHRRPGLMSSGDDKARRCHTLSLCVEWQKLEMMGGGGLALVFDLQGFLRYYN